MKKAVIYIIICVMAFLLTACSGPSPSVSGGDYLSIENLVVLSGTQSCSWNSQGDDNLGIFASKGVFLIDNGQYYFENKADSVQGSPVTRYAYFDSEYYSNWNDISVPGRPMIVTKYGLDKYNTVVTGKLGWKLYFNLHPDFDYGITCQEVGSVTLQTPPSDAQLVEV